MNNLNPEFNHLKDKSKVRGIFDTISVKAR